MHRSVRLPATPSPLGRASIERSSCLSSRLGGHLEDETVCSPVRQRLELGTRGFG